MTLTQEIFADQPDWVDFAAIDKSGDVLGFEHDPHASQDSHGWIVTPFSNKCVVIDDSEAYKSNQWQRSIVKRRSV